MRSPQKSQAKAWGPGFRPKRVRHLGFAKLTPRNHVQDWAGLGLLHLRDEIQLSTDRALGEHGTVTAG